jgi:hypothetical protein
MICEREAGDYSGQARQINRHRRRLVADGLSLMACRGSGCHYDAREPGRSRAMPRYWVVGGEYADTKFKKIAGGGKETRLGPFDGYAAAKDAWQAKAWATVDSANTRYRIVKEAKPRRRPAASGGKAASKAKT